MNNNAVKCLGDNGVCIPLKTYSYEKKTTNADKIRAMSDEELAEFFNKFDNVCDMCSKNIGCFIVDTDRCKNSILEWLQSEEE